MSILPEFEQSLAIIGGKQLPRAGQEMAQFLGEAVIAAGYRLLTGGRSGAGECASIGAARECFRKGIPVQQHVFAIVPFGTDPDFQQCKPVHAGKDTFQRSIVLMNRAKRAFVIGGGKGTKHEVMHAAVEYYMAWGGADILPVAGTGGLADEILTRLHPDNDPILANPDPSRRKAEALVRYAKSGEGWLCLNALWGIDVHEAFQKDHARNPDVRRFSKIRHYREKIRIEGEK